MKVGFKRIKVDVPYDMWVGLQRMKGKSDEVRVLTLIALFNRKHDELESRAKTAVEEARVEAAAAQKLPARAWRGMKALFTAKCGAKYRDNPEACTEPKGHDGAHDNGDVRWVDEPAAESAPKDAA